MGGAERARIFWRQNYFGTQGIIYLIDASKDIENIGISLKELEKVVIDPDLNDVYKNIIRMLRFQQQFLLIMLKQKRITSLIILFT